MVYKYTNTATYGHLTDSTGFGHLDNFSSSSPNVTYTAGSNGGGSDTITVTPQLVVTGQPNTDLTTATASVTVGAPSTPAPGVIVASSLTLSPGTTCIDVGFSGGTYSYSVSAATNAPPGTQLYYGYRLGGGGTLTVPPPTTNLSYLPSDYPQVGDTAGPANTATVSFPPTSTDYGYNANFSVILLYPPDYPDYLGLGVIYLTGGKAAAEANVEFELGLDTCAAQGLTSGVKSSAARYRSTGTAGQRKSIGFPLTVPIT